MGDKNKPIRVRVFNIMQYAFHPITGEKLLDEEQIESGVGHKSIKRYAWVKHDKDVYTEQDELDDRTDCKAGDPKGVHFHIVGECPNTVELPMLARWFNIPENYIDLPKGQGAFLDCVQYLTHESDKEQDKGKTLYPDEEVHSNFNFREELTQRTERRLKYGRDLTPKERMRYDVLYNGKTLKECMAEDRLIVLEDLDKLKKFRLEYIRLQDPPQTRINYYICGKGGIGKGLISRALARSLYPNIKDDEDIFFEVGAKGAALEGYDGQPVIIWSDRRAGDLLAELGNRGNVFNVFDTHPCKSQQNIKFSSTNLCNEVNIVNSVEPYTDFLNALSGEYTDKNGAKHTSEDKDQSYRRFPFIIPLHKEDFDLLLNKGFVDGDDYQEYIAYRHISGNMRRIMQICGNNAALARLLSSQTLKPVTDKHTEVLAKIGTEGKDKTEDEILAMFANYGKVGEVEDYKIKDKDDDDTPPPPEPPKQMDLNDYIDLDYALSPDFWKGGEDNGKGQS